MSRQFGRLDVKARTMKYAILDPDIASKYEDLDDDEGSYGAKKVKLIIKNRGVGPKPGSFTS